MTIIGSLNNAYSFEFINAEAYSTGGGVYISLVTYKLRGSIYYFTINNEYKYIYAVYDNENLYSDNMLFSDNIKNNKSFIINQLYNIAINELKKINK